MPDRVHAAVNAVQAAGGYPRRDGVAPEAKRRKLASCDQSVLAFGETWKAPVTTT